MNSEYYLIFQKRFRSPTVSQSLHRLWRFWCLSLILRTEQNLQLLLKRKLLLRGLIPSCYITYSKNIPLQINHNFTLFSLTNQILNSCSHFIFLKHKSSHPYPHLNNFPIYGDFPLGPPYPSYSSLCYPNPSSCLHTPQLAAPIPAFSLQGR